MATWNDLILDSLIEIGAYTVGQSLAASEATYAQNKLNDILDEWAARRVDAYNVSFSVFTLTAAHQPHLIGPGLVSPDFAVTQRPIRIESANLIIGTGATAVDVPILVKDDDWWANVRIKSLTTNVPKWLYYSPDFPNGSLYFWPIPNTAYNVRLELWGLISQISNFGATISLPPAYRKAIKLTLAEELSEPFGREPGPKLMDSARKARMALQGNNSKSPRTATVDAGMPKGTTRPRFNFLTGEPW